MIARPDWMSVGMDCPISWRIASVSLVKGDMIAPCGCVSKKRRGRRSMESNMSSRMCLSVPCVTIAMARVQM